MIKNKCSVVFRERARHLRNSDSRNVVFREFCKRLGKK